MRCPFCNSDDYYRRGNAPSDDGEFWRKYRCMGCSKWFYTIEQSTREKPTLPYKTNWIKKKMEV